MITSKFPLVTNLKLFKHILFCILIRPGVARAVLQTASSFINKLTLILFLHIYSLYCWDLSTGQVKALSYGDTCTETVPRQEEGSTGKYKHEVKGVPEGAARGNSRDRMLVFSCTPRLESRYRHYSIDKSDEALVIAIVIAMSRAIAMSKQRTKKGNRLRFFLVW